MKTEATRPLAPSAGEGEMERSPAKERGTLIPLTHYVGARGAAYSRKFYHTCKDMIWRNADKLPIDTLVGYRWGDAVQLHINRIGTLDTVDCRASVGRSQ